MTEFVLVATDGGPGSAAPLDWVISRGRHLDLNVEMVTVEETDWLPVGADKTEYRRTYAAALHAGEVRVAAHSGITALDAVLLSGEADVELASASRFADLLVVASAYVGPMRAALGATIALKLAQHSQCALVVVPPRWRNTKGKIVVGVDEDGSSDAAVDFGTREAQRLGLVLELVHVWSLPKPFAMLGPVRRGRYPHLEKVHRQYLDQAIARARAIAPTIAITDTLQPGDAAETLVRAADTASMVVVGTHRRGTVRRLALGSVTQRIIAAAECATAVVRPDAVHPSTMTTYPRTGIVNSSLPQGFGVVRAEGGPLP